MPESLPRYAAASARTPATWSSARSASTTSAAAPSGSVWRSASAGPANHTTGRRASWRTRCAMASNRSGGQFFLADPLPGWMATNPSPRPRAAARARAASIAASESGIRGAAGTAPTLSAAVTCRPTHAAALSCHSAGGSGSAETTCGTCPAARGAVAKPLAKAPFVRKSITRSASAKSDGAGPPGPVPAATRHRPHVSASAQSSTTPARCASAARSGRPTRVIRTCGHVVRTASSAASAWTKSPMAPAWMTTMCFMVASAAPEPRLLARTFRAVHA